MKKAWDFVSEARWWIGYIVFVFLLGVACGVIISLVNPDLSRAFFQSYGKSLQKIGFETDLKTAWFIFERNGGILIGTFVFGLFGLVPTIVAFVNGMIFGMYFGFLDIYAVLSPLKLIFLILPHGIFEITASLVGFGLSTRTGLHWLFAKKEKRKVFVQDLIASLRVGFFVIALLAVAALVEAFVTPAITCFLFRICF
ncbi:MAG: stage II sporulation protein M [bacterium]|nr:stage II sporulation protein M [bacterium]